MAALRRVNGIGLLVFAGFIAVWQLAISLFAANQATVAAPSAILSSLGETGMAAPLMGAVAHTAIAACVGWAAAMVVGVALGVWIGLSRAAWNLSMSSVDFLRAVPPIALVSPLVLVFGFSVSMEISVIFYGCVWPIMINTALGMRQIPRQVHEMATTLRLPRALMLLHVAVPWAAPMIVVGARLAMTLAVILAVVAEMVGNPEGIGYQIVFYQQALNPGALYLFIVSAGILALVMNALLVACFQLFRPITRRRAANG